MPHRANLLLSKFHLLIASLLPYLIVSFCLSSCSRPAHNDSFSLTFLIEASPTNLDPPFATDPNASMDSSLVACWSATIKCISTGILPNPGQLPTHSPTSSIFAAVFASMRAAR